MPFSNTSLNDRNNYSFRNSSYGRSIPGAIKIVVYKIVPKVDSNLKKQQISSIKQW